MLLSIGTLLHVTLNMDIAPCYSLYRHCSMLLSIQTLLHVTLYTYIAPCYSKHGHCSILLYTWTLLEVTLNMDIAPYYSLYRYCPMLLSIRAFLHVTLYMDIAPSYSKHGHCSMLLYTVITPCYSIYGHHWNYIQTITALQLKCDFENKIIMFGHLLIELVSVVVTNMSNNAMWEQFCVNACCSCGWQNQQWRSWSRRGGTNEKVSMTYISSHYKTTSELYKKKYCRLTPICLSMS